MVLAPFGVIKMCPRSPKCLLVKPLFSPLECHLTSRRNLCSRAFMAILVFEDFRYVDSILWVGEKVALRLNFLHHRCRSLELAFCKGRLSAFGT